MKKSCCIILISLIVIVCLESCHDAPDYDNNLTDTYDCLWTLIDEHYCYFDEKNIDWQAAGEKHREELKEVKTWMDAFEVCSHLLDELRDGHVNLSSAFGTSYYRKWWTDYPQDFNLRTLQEYYLKFDYWSLNGISYKKITPETGYVYYPSFSYSLSESNLDNILKYFEPCKALIIDVRNNGGGELTNIHRLVGRFVESDFTGGYMMHKTGPGHNEFSSPYAVEYKATRDRVHWSTDKPVYVLANRSCFSAANDFVAVMRMLPNVKIVGARTGGGGAMPFSYDLPNGWVLRLSVTPMLDSEMNSIEHGVNPTDGFAVSAPAEELAAGKDAILDFALLHAREAM